MTQCPFSAATSSAFSATTSCPCPRDTLWSFPLSMVNPSFFPKEGENRKSTGVIQNRGSSAAFLAGNATCLPFCLLWAGNTHPVTWPCFSHLERCGPGTSRKLAPRCAAVSLVPPSAPQNACDLELPLHSPCLVTAVCSPPCASACYRHFMEMGPHTLRPSVFLHELHAFDCLIREEAWTQLME